MTPLEFLLWVFSGALGIVLLGIVSVFVIVAIKSALAQEGEKKIMTDFVKVSLFILLMFIIAVIFASPSSSQPYTVEHLTTGVENSVTKQTQTFYSDIQEYRIAQEKGEVKSSLDLARVAAIMIDDHKKYQKVVPSVLSTLGFNPKTILLIMVNKAKAKHYFAAAIQIKPVNVILKYAPNLSIGMVENKNKVFVIISTRKDAAKVKIRHTQ